jgi:hypothetical protein
MPLGMTYFACETISAHCMAARFSGEFAELEDDALVIAVQRGAINALVAIRDNPWTGAENRARTGSGHIADGRHV